MTKHFDVSVCAFTCPCILATAFIRFTLVCLPTRQILTRKVLWAIAIVILVVPVASVSGYGFHYLSTIENPCWEVGCPNVQTICEEFLNSRSFIRVFLEMLVCLIMPATISGFFYLSVGIQLMKRESERARNRNLSLAFVLSWLLWVLCWVPYYIGMSIRYEPTQNDDYQNWTQSLVQFSPIFSQLESYFILYKLSIQMLYSHINVLIYIVVLKPFRQWILDCFMEVLRSPLYNISSKSSKKPLWHQKAASIGSAMRKAGVFLLMAVLFYSSGFTLSVSSFYLSRVGNLESKYQTARHICAEMRSTSLKTYSKHAPWFRTSTGIRNLCGNNHGELNFMYNRCFFVLSHVSSPKNMMEQHELCSSKSADLVYPRSEQELFFIWSFYEMFRGWNSETELTNFDDWFIRIGLRKHVFGDYVLFLDIDETFQITNDQGYDSDPTDFYISDLELWFQSHVFPKWLYLFDDTSHQPRLIDAPAFCLTKLNQHCYLCYLLECLPRTPVNYTMCSIDFRRR